jgi:Spy/CpxP family protein refolding chaperone
MMNKLLRTTALVAGLLGLAVSLPAFSQPVHGGMDGLFMGLGKIKSQLNLTTSQQVQWDAVVAQAQATHAAMKENRQQIKEVLQTELAKAEPDLAAVAAVSDSVRQAGITAHQQVRNAWLALYATFSPEQKAVVKTALIARLQRMENFREHMQGRMMQPNG